VLRQAAQDVRLDLVLLLLAVIARRPAIHPDRFIFWKGMEICRSLVRAYEALPDSRGNDCHRYKRDVQTFLIRAFDAPFFQKTRS
jgi:hypothetical protein